MFRRLFALLLISLIASQSVLAAADTHLDMQSGDDHQQVNHGHSSTPNPAVGGGDVLEKSSCDYDSACVCV